MPVLPCGRLLVPDIGDDVVVPAVREHQALDVAVSNLPWRSVLVEQSPREIRGLQGNVPAFVGASLVYPAELHLLEVEADAVLRVLGADAPAIGNPAEADVLAVAEQHLFHASPDAVGLLLHLVAGDMVRVRLAPDRGIFLQPVLREADVLPPPAHKLGQSRFSGELVPAEFQSFLLLVGFLLQKGDVFFPPALVFQIMVQPMEEMPCPSDDDVVPTVHEGEPLVEQQRALLRPYDGYRNRIHASHLQYSELLLCMIIP